MLSICCHSVMRCLLLDQILVLICWPCFLHILETCLRVLCGDLPSLAHTWYDLLALLALDFALAPAAALAVEVWLCKELSCSCCCCFAAIGEHCCVNEGWPLCCSCASFTCAVCPQFNSSCCVKCCSILACVVLIASIAASKCQHYCIMLSDGNYFKCISFYFAGKITRGFCAIRSARSAAKHFSCN